MDNRNLLCQAAKKINSQYNDTKVTGKFGALVKLFVSPKRDWGKPGAPRIGWKRGELLEVFLAFLNADNFTMEWGDVGYYAAQSYDWVWWLYSIITPKYIIDLAVKKFTARARKWSK